MNFAAGRSIYSSSRCSVVVFVGFRCCNVLARRTSSRNGWLYQFRAPNRTGTDGVGGRWSVWLDRLSLMISGPRSPRSSTAALRSKRQPAADRDSCGFDRHPVRAALRPGVGDAAVRDGLRLRHDSVGVCATGRRRACGTACIRSLERLRRVSIGEGRAWTLLLCRPKKGLCHGPNPTDRGKPGTKRHLVTDARGARRSASA